MKLARLISQLGMGFITFCFITAAPAGIPIWSFAQVTGFPPTTTVSATGTATVKYTVSNNSSKEHKLVLKPQRGVSQNSSCLLGHKGSSCTLLLTITGSALPASGLSGGPILCQANPDGRPNPSQCYQPNKEDSLKISISSAVNYTVGGSVSGLSGTLVLTNNGGDAQTITANGTFHFSALASGSTYSVAVQSAPANQTCTVSNGLGTIGGANVTNVGVNCVTNAMTLITSISDLALSVTGLTEYGITGTPSSGIARVITITNNGGFTAKNLVVTSLSSPSGFSTTTCGTSLAASSSCTITVTPGSVPTSDGTNPCSTHGTAPVPDVINVTSSNASGVSINVKVLSYGCIYQGGHIYAFDDTTATSRSVGGKVSTTIDQAASYPSGIVWGSNGDAGGGVGGLDFADVSYDTIPGIDEASTFSTGSPTYTTPAGPTGFTFTDFFSSTYTNANPWTSSPFSTCIGNSNGPCNTGNILTFYNQFITNYSYSGTAPFTASAGPTNPAYYAAGLCSGTISSYSDWYLPAICELGYDEAGHGSGCGTSGAPTLQNMLSSLVDYNNLELLSGFYWSSTEYSQDPQSLAWGHQFNSGGGSYQSATNKAYMLGIRCSRALTI